MIKKSSALKVLSFLLILFLSFPVVLAQEEPAEAGVTPDSFWWGLDKALDQISLLLSLGPEDKARKGLEIAQERLLEVKVMAEQQNLDAAEKAQAEHRKILGKVKGVVSSLDEDESERELEQELEIEQELREHEEEVERVSAELKVKIKIEGQLSPEQQERLHEFLRSLETNADEVKLELVQKREKTIIKIKEETGRSEKEIEQEIEQLATARGIPESDTEVKATIVGSRTFIKVEKEFETTVEFRDLLPFQIAERFALDEADVRSFLELEIEEDEVEEEEKLKIKGEARKGEVEIEVELRFWLDSVDNEDIIKAIVERTRLSPEEIDRRLELEILESEETAKAGPEVKIKIKDGQAVAMVKLADGEKRIILQEKFHKAMMVEVAKELGIPLGELRFTIEEESEEETAGRELEEQTTDDDDTDDSDEEEEDEDEQETTEQEGDDEERSGSSSGRG